MLTRRPTNPQENDRELITWFREGKIKPHISATYPLEDAAQALNDLLERKVKGKVVLVTNRG